MMAHEVHRMGEIKILCMFYVVIPHLEGGKRKFALLIY